MEFHGFGRVLVVVVDILEELQAFGAVVVADHLAGELVGVELALSVDPSHVDGA